MDNIMGTNEATDHERLKWELLGSCQSIEAAIEKLDLNPDIDWEDEMLTAGVEVCLGCGWWEESGALVDEEGNVGYCEDCIEKSEDEFAYF